MTGLFFGSFNPIHIGHMAIANYMLEFGKLKEIWFVISPHNPFKEKKSLISQYDRLEMINLAIGDFQYFKPCDIEFHLPVPSYTIDTLTYLSDKFPKKEFVLIMGADVIDTFDRWKNYELIIKKYKRLIYPRPKVVIKKTENLENAEIVNAPIIEISSSFIRQAIKDNKNIPFFLPSKVYDYIIKMNLYKK
jgi:nicotinate-nucleotide adenylyltransferase